MTTPTDANENLEAAAGAPPIPDEPSLDPTDSRTGLQERLRTLLRGLPAYFEFKNTISGVIATDLFSLNTLLGAAIEGEVVRTLNQQRGLWDPDNEWLGYVFERQSQTFPDVRLVRKVSATESAVALGVELKGWFLLAKEGVPSFRFTTTPAACAPHDLLVVVPWHLDNVLSGAPVAVEPWIASSRWAADYRNYWWKNVRVSRGPRGIQSPPDAAPYPRSDEEIADFPDYDKGGNFGRVARVEGLMDDWIAATNNVEVLGIRIRDWAMFLRLHGQASDLDAVSGQISTSLARAQGVASLGKAQEIRGLLDQLRDALGD